MSLNQQQILALAPDEASAKAGKQLASTSKWLVKNIHPAALWGECQGSGKTPYKTAIDLTNIAFKCSCPSRKFPCKHGLGLFLLYATNPNDFSRENTLTAEIEEWLNKRSSKAEQKEKKADKPVDEAAKQKREDSREKKVLAGIDELQAWIKDLVRTGIINVPQNQYKFTSNIIARMVDSQAPGLAYQLKKINKIDFHKDGWQSALLKQLSSLYAISEAYKHKDKQTALVKEDLLSLIGWTKAKDEILQTESFNDAWLVLAKTTESEDNLNIESIWLYGTKHQKFANIINYYSGNQLPGNIISAGTTLNAELVYYPSSYPLRALIKTQTEQIFSTTIQPGINTVELLKIKVTDIVSTTPFTEKVPFILSDFKIYQQGTNWFIKDHDHTAIQISNTEHESWSILSVSKGKPFTCFALYESEKVVIYSIWADHTFYTIK